MKKILISISIIVLIFCAFYLIKNSKTNENELKNMQGNVLSIQNNQLIIQDNNNIIHTFNLNDSDIQVGSDISIEYKDNEIINYEIKTASNELPQNWQDNGLFKEFYNMAYNKLQTLTLDEKIGQLFLVRYDEKNDIDTLKKYKFAGYVFYKKDFENKTTEEVQNMIKGLQNNSNIPLLTAVDEEGGKVVRISSNPNLVAEEFKSPSELYALGSFDLIKEDTINKSKILNHLGINLNLAPVVDVSTNPNDYIYDRTLGQNVELTKKYAKTVIEASKKTNVSYTLKHFPGYGNNQDTHTNTSTDNRTFESIVQNDLPPFEEGIKAEAEAVLVSHNIVTSIDPNNPASLSKEVHNLLRDDLKFTGIIITDDLNMGATNSIDNATIKALLSGNDLLIITDYEESINSVKKAINDGTISENLIDKLAFRVIAWKYYKGLMLENYK